MKSPLEFLPYPRKVDYIGGELAIEPRKLILLLCPQPQRLLFSARRIQSEVQKATGCVWELNASAAVPGNQIGLILELETGSMQVDQAYQLHIHPERIHIRAQDEAGIFYGACTLIQILQQCGARLPCLVIEDHPDFLSRGVMLDISRDKVPKMETLFELVDRLASWKINQLQLYTEHTFAYQNHPVVWQDSSPVTAQEVLELDAYCRLRYINLVPNQNSFGHLTNWLKHPEYAGLAETMEEFDTPWGKVQGPYSLAPVNPGSLRLIQSLYDELLPNFSSRMVNVGCDETFDVGAGQSREACTKRGADRVMFDYLLALYQDISRRGLTMQFWADILVHNPHLLNEMPKDAVALIWNYEAAYSFDGSSAMFENASMPFYVCPGTSSWNSIAGRAQNALENNLDAAVSGLEHGAQGFLNTDWGDNGHWQVLPISLPGFVAGAAYSWCMKTNRDAPIEDLLSRFAFEDDTGASAAALFRLGNVYRETDYDLPNSSPLFWLLQYPLSTLRNFPHVSAEHYDACLAEIDGALADLSRAKIKRADNELIRDEIQLAARMMRHACRRCQLLHESTSSVDVGFIRQMKADVMEWLEEYRRIWLERNRPGGLADSAARIERLVDEYNRLES